MQIFVYIYNIYVVASKIKNPEKRLHFKLQDTCNPNILALNRL